MKSKCTRLDRFLSVHSGIKRRDVRLVLARGRVLVDGLVARDINQTIDEFSHVIVDDHVLQAKTPKYIMMNKPMGVVSATRDNKHITVIDLLNQPNCEDLHIVGRLDFNTTGLILLTNDSRWSRHLMSPEMKVEKHYQVFLENPITAEYSDAFAKGIYFAFENITTRPATLSVISDYIAEVKLIEGRYHQIKRMFGRFQNPVLQLHRLAIGNLALDPALEFGQNRALTTLEVAGLRSTQSPIV